MNPLLSKLREERTSLKETIQSTLDVAATEERDLSDAEQKNVDEAFGKVKELDERIEYLSDIELRNAKAAELASKVDEANKVETTTKVKVNNEPLTYTRDSKSSFLVDAFRAQFFSDYNAQSRIARHMQEMEVEQRDVGTSAFAGLVVPQYLTDMVAELARAGRPIANSVRSLGLPRDGMTVNISRITTGSAVAVQASENDAVQETNIDDTLLTVNVNTYAGQQDVSRQALERGTGIDEVVFADLAADYAAKLDTAIISGDGTGGTHLGILSTTGIQTVGANTATIAALYPKIADAVQKVNSNRYLPATVVYMHPRRWGWFTAQLDSGDRPLVLPNAHSPQNAVGVGQAAAYGQVVGSLLGLPVITDANLPTNLGASTNEDRIIVARASDLVLWEQGNGAPAQLRFEQTLGGSLTVKLVVYGYSAFTAGRQPNSVAVVQGTALVTPTF